jgi:outer membrane protein assembly factor BamD (BamD/ComL family)
MICKKLRLIIILAAAFIISSCVTTVIVNEDMSSAEIMQRAQEAMDRNRYQAAIQYYEALYARNQTNIDLMITSEYHIAHIKYKQKKYDEAREGFNGVLSYYTTADAILLPQHFRILSQTVLDNISGKE